MPTTRSAGRKRQTVLHLTSVVSSSPSNATAHVGSRLATVRYEELPQANRNSAFTMDINTTRKTSRQAASKSTPMVGSWSGSMVGLDALPSPARGLQMMVTGLQSPDPSSQPQQLRKIDGKPPTSGFSSSPDSDIPATRSGKVGTALFGMTKVVPTKAAMDVVLQFDQSDSDLEIKTPTRYRAYTNLKLKRISRPSSSHHLIPSQSFNSSSEESIKVCPQKRRRLNRTAKHCRKYSGSEESIDEIAEDVEDLQDTELQVRRTRARPAETKQSKAMELLKLRRANKGASSPATAKDEDNQFSDQRKDSQCVFPDQDVDPDGLDGVRQTLQEDLDVSDAEFVTSDEEALLGAPSALADLPLEYTRHSHKPLKDHFKDAVEWFVHNKLNPAFPRYDPIYRVAFNRLDDEVKGYSGSKFISSAWTGDFARSLKARPGITCRPAGQALFERKCEACNRSGHPATWQISFSGKIYNKDTLEEIGDCSDDEDTRDSRGNYVPQADKQYLVGRFCKSNAEMAHALLHWRYAFNGWVIDWLSTHSHTSPAKIIQRESWSTKKRRECANHVVDGMEDAGQIKALWRDWKIIRDQARNKPARSGRGEE